jgi:aspartyl-tRNA(Asn)/glutamyl-tRNA(Gln) amidotransferase subunit B
VLAAEATAVAEYRSGKKQVYGFLVGRVMAHLDGKADARLVNEELRRRLDEVESG